MILEIKEGMMAFIPQRASGAMESQPYLISGSLDMFGDITLTVNLTVQQSQWVYLKGPVTSSGMLINGDITASNLFIRRARGDGEFGNQSYGKAEIEGELVANGINLTQKIEELENRINELENAIRRR